MKSRLGEREISNAKIRLNVRGLHIRISILRLPGSSTSARIGDSNGGMLARSWSRTTLPSSFRVGRDDPRVQTDRHRLAVLGYGTLQGGLGSRRRLCQGQSESRDTAWRSDGELPLLTPKTGSSGRDINAMTPIHLLRSSRSYFNHSLMITATITPSGT